MGRNTHTFQSSFTSGELDPSLAARGDVKFYYNGCAELDDFEVIPQGGITRRPGTANIGKLAGNVFDYASDTESVFVLQATGTPIGSFPELAELFDGITATAHRDNVVTGLGGPEYGGKDWGVGNTKIILSAQIYVLRIPVVLGAYFVLQGSTDNFSASIVDLGSLGWLPAEGEQASGGYTITATDISTAYRYHRVKCINAAGEESYEVAEIYFCEKNQLGGYAASTTNGGTAANAVDGSNSTYLTNTTNLSTTDDYVVVTVDLGEARSVRFVDAVNIYLSNATVEECNEFNIEYSDDNFSSDVNVFGSKLPGITSSKIKYRVEASDREPVSARYWRLIRNGATDMGTTKPGIGELRFRIDLGTVGNTRLIPFEFNTEQTYIMAASDRNIAVVKDGVVIANIPIPHASSELLTLNWTQSADTIIFVHENHAPLQVQRDSDNDRIWNVSTFDLTYVPKYDFVPTITSYTGSDDYITPNAKEGSISLTLASSSGLSWSTATHVGQIVDVNGGLARITKRQSATVALAVVIIPMYTTDQDTSWDLLGGYEDVWSASRGWPKSCCFFEGRLWFGGSLKRPHSLWGSRVEDFGNFDTGQGLADEAVVVTLDTDQINEITQVFPGRDLQVFTSGAEFYLPQPLGEPITSETIQVKRETSRGSKKGLRVSEVEGGTIFIQRGGKGVREYLYNEVEQSYNADNISLLSSHLIEGPVDFAIRRANETNEADQILIVNSDGSMAACSTLRSQDITAWTPWQLKNAKTTNVAALRGSPAAQETTISCDGTTTSVAVAEFDIDNPVYVINERTIDGSTDRYIEVLVGTRLSDFGVLDTIAETNLQQAIPQIASAAHLEGETVAVFKNGFYVGSTTISGGYTTDLYDVTEDDEWEIGYAWMPSGKTMPVNLDVEGGSIRARKKRAVQATFFVEDSDNLECNDNTQTVAADTTGQIAFQALREYNKDGQVQFTQTVPGKLTILAIDLEVSF